MLQQLEGASLNTKQNKQNNAVMSLQLSFDNLHREAKETQPLHQSSYFLKGCRLFSPNKTYFMK